MRTSEIHEGRLKELDGWRAISVLMVAAFHLQAERHVLDLARHVHLAMAFYSIGALGVKVFFVISGFVICRLLTLEERRFGAVSLKGFYIRRVFRILPPLYFYLACLGLLLSAGLIDETWKGICSGAFFLNDFLPTRVLTWTTGHTWSLAVEEQFYLSFPILWILTRKQGTARIFIGVFCLLAAWNLCAALSGWNHLTDPKIRAGFACICWGVVLASIESVVRRVARKIPSLAAAVIAFSLLWHPVNPSGWESALYDSIYTPLAVGVILIFSLEGDLWLRTFLCWKPVQAIGVTSYGIYLWQQLFTISPRYVSHSGRPILYLLPLLLVVVPFSWFFIEQPATRFGRSLAERARSSPLRQALSA